MPPFDDVRVRRAFSAAIDRQYLAKTVLNGQIAATTFAPPGMPGAVEPGSAGQGFDPELARALFQEFLDEKGLTVEQFNAAYGVVLAQTNHSSMTSAVLEMWQETLGVEVQTDIRSRGDFRAALEKTTLVDPPFHIYRKTWCADYPDQSNAIHAVFNAAEGLNEVRRTCADPTCQQTTGPTEFDRLTIQASRSSDPAERDALYARAEHLLAHDEAAYAPVYHWVGHAFTRPRLSRGYPSFGPPDFSRWTLATGEEE